MATSEPQSEEVPTPRATKLAALRKKARPVAFAVMCGSVTLDILNVTGLAFDQVNISEHFGVDLPTASWSLSAYALTFGSFLLLAGRAGDMYGHKRIYSFGLLAFALFAALTAGVDENFIAFCVLRALKGVAAACTIPTAYAIVANTYEGKSRELAVAGLGAATTLGAIGGTIIGGAFGVSSLGYRGLLWLSFSLAMVLCALAFLLIPETPTIASKDRKRLDYIGAFLVTAAALVTVYGFTEAPTGWSKAKVIAPIVVGVVMFVVFFIYEQYVVWRVMSGTDPLIPRRVWNYPNLVPIAFITGFMYGSFFLVVLNGSSFLIRVQGRTALISAVQNVPIAAGSLCFLFIFGPMYNHKFLPPKWVVTASGPILLVAVLLYSRNEIHSAYWHWTFPATVVMSLGTVIFFINFLNIAFASSPLDDQGLISGIVQTVAQVSTGISFAIGSSFIEAADPEVLLLQYRKSFYVSMALAGMAFLISLVFLKNVPRREEVLVKDDEESAVVPSDEETAVVEKKREEDNASTL